MNVSRVILALAALTATAPAAAAADDAPGARVLVMKFAVEADSAAPGAAGANFWLGEAAAVLLTDYLASLGAGTLTRDERVAAFDRLELPMSSALTRATMIRVGELVSASDVVFGEVRLGARLSVRARLVRLETGQQLADVADDAALQDIFPLFERVAGRIAAATGRPIVPTPRGVSQLPLEVFENYIKGLVAATPAAQQRFLESALKQASSDPRLLMALWDVYTLQAAHDRALAVAGAVPADSPLSRKARFSVALSLIELKRYDGAFKALKDLYAERRSAVLSNALGLIQLRRGATPETGTPPYFFNRAVEEETGDTDYLFNLGYAYALARESSSALFWLREALRYDAANGDAHLVISAVLAASGKAAESQRELELARQLGTRLDESALVLSDKVPAGLERLRSDLDIPSAGRVIGNPAQRDQRETAAYHLERGRRLFNERNDREAIDELRRAVYLTPYEDEPHLLLGRLYQRAGRLPEAIDEFKVAIWCRETAAARIALADALLESGERDAARREVERALVLQPDSADAKALLKRIGGLDEDCTP